MDDISRQLGISKKTIYESFEDKNQLVMALIVQIMSAHHQQFESFSKEARNAIDEMMMMMRYLGNEFSKLNPNLFYDLQKYHPLAWKEFRAFKCRDAINSVIQNLERGKSEGYYRKEVNNQILATLRMEEVELAMNPAVYPSGTYHIVEVQMQLLLHFLHGICTLKGHKLLNKYLEIKEDE